MTAARNANTRCLNRFRLRLFLDGHLRPRNGEARCCGGNHDHAGHDHAHAIDHAHGRDRVRDPVCGMTVDPATAQASAEHEGEPIISARPAAAPSSSPIPQSISRRKPKAPDAGARRHDLHLPDASARSGRSAPAACPICGMALEPEVVPAETRPNPELADMTRRFWIGLVLDAAGRSRWKWAAIWPACTAGSTDACRTGSSCVFATPVVLWAGWPFFVRGWQSLVDAQSQHVHADRDGHRRRLALQRRRHARARALPGRVPRP